MTGSDRVVGVDAVYEDELDIPHPVAAIYARYAPDHVLTIALAVVSTLGWNLLHLVPPYLLGVAVDAFFTGGGRLSVAFVPDAWIPASVKGQFGFFALLFGAVVVATSVLHAVRFLSWRWLEDAVGHDLRVDAYESVQRLGLDFFVSEQTGNVMSVLNDDVQQLDDLVADWPREVIGFAAFTVGLVAVMLALHWQLALVTMAFTPPVLVLSRGYQRRVEERYDERRRATGALNARLQNSVSGIETVKAFTAGGHERDRVEVASRSVWRADWSVAKLSGLFYPARDLLMRGVTVAILVVGGWWALFGSPLGLSAPLSAGTFVTFFYYGQQFVGRVSAVGDLVDTYVDGKASAKRVVGLLHYPASVPEADDPVALTGVDGRVEYDDVTFSYPGAEEPAVRDVSFVADPGDFVGVVGPTGAGKTTVLKLLFRFYDPEDGTVTVDGTDIADVSLESLRGAVGYVSQEPFLFDGTVRENIAYARPDADDDAVQAAARRANAHGFVADLSDGYDTDVGERGVKLSGGQRQRIAIARAILKDPEILVLDEATSHVDNETELLIQDSLAEVAADRTTFAVAHRLSTVRNADTLLVMRDGEVVERGTHDDLVARGGLYATLWGVHTGEVESVPDALEPTD